MSPLPERIGAVGLAWSATAWTLAHAATPPAGSIPAAQGCDKISFIADKLGGQITVMQLEVIR